MITKGSIVKSISRNSQRDLEMIGDVIEVTKERLLLHPVSIRVKVGETYITDFIPYANTIAILKDEDKPILINPQEFDEYLDSKLLPTISDESLITLLEKHKSQEQPPIDYDIEE